MKGKNLILKALNIFTVLLLITTIPKIEYAAGKIKMGDINQDNKIDSIDLLMMLRHNTAQTRNDRQSWILKDDKFTAADINKDGTIDTRDMLALVRYIVASNRPTEIGKKHPEWLVLDKEEPTSTPEQVPEPTPSTIEVSSLILNKTNLTLEIGKSEILIATIKPSNATNKEVTWSTSNNKIATVDKNGKVTAVANGTTTITAKSNNNITATCTITVNKVVSKITLDKTKIELDLSGTKTAQISATIEPKDATNKEITWSTSNNKIATVDKNGKVTAVANGTATITAKSNNNKVTATSTVKVKTNPTSIKLSKTKATIEAGKTITLTAKLEPKSVTEKGVTWSTNNKKIATVDKNGKVTAKIGGKVTITSKTENGKTEKCTITVTKSVTVSFKANGGSGGGTQKFTYGVKNQKFNVKVSRDGYSFVKWNTKANGTGNNYNFNNSVNDNWINSNSSKVTLYATWKANSFKNPLMSGADPFVYQKDGYYYYIRSTGNSIQIFKTTLLNKLTQSGGKTVYRGGSIWAPELHYFNNHWYIYAAIQYDSNEGSRRMYVFESKTSDPLGSYTRIGALNTGGWAIDGTVLNYNNKLYFIWSGWPGSYNGQQNLYIAQMSSPKRISGSRVRISTPTNWWETYGWPDVNEGPQVLKHNGKVFIVYSASGSWTSHYCLGMLSLNGSNPLNSSSWRKSGPVFSSGNGVYGPGHACFVKSPDGKEDWIVYHGNTRLVSEGDAWWNNRKVFIQKFGWNKNGTPNFGKPLSISTSINPPSGTK